MGRHPAAKPQLPLFPLILISFQNLLHCFQSLPASHLQLGGRNPLCGWVWGRDVWPAAVHRMLTGKARKSDNQGRRSISWIRGMAGVGGLCHAPHFSCRATGWRAHCSWSRREARSAHSSSRSSLSQGEQDLHLG